MTILGMFDSSIFMITDCILKPLVFTSNACLYDVEAANWTCAGDFHFSYVFPVCGMYKQDDGI